MMNQHIAHWGINKTRYLAEGSGVPREDAGEGNLELSLEMEQRG